MSFAATWMNLEIIILSEVSQTKANIIRLIHGITKRYKRTYLQNRNRTHRLMVIKRRRAGEGMNQGVGNNTYTLK